MEYQGFPLTIDVTLDTATGPIRGEIREVERRGRPFSGRLELLSELALWQESARKRLPSVADGTPGRKERT